MHFTNPIIPGFAPDPSIVLVRDTFYLVNSSFHVFPGLSVYTSRDLLSWKLMNHAISRPAQISLDHSWMMHIKVPRPSDLVITGGLFAPTIRYHDSTFYIVCTNAVEDPVSKEHSFRNFFISCPEARIDVAGSWSDPVYFDFPGIDPSLLFHNGRAYIQGSYREGPPWAPDCSIRQFEIDLNTGKPLSDIKFFWGGANPGGHAEGPHLYHKDDWFYLVTAEGSTFEGHQINIARSREIWGPYESYQHNPLLTALDTQNEVQ
jgi:beta-xylosidase